MKRLLLCLVVGAMVFGVQAGEDCYLLQDKNCLEKPDFLLKKIVVSYQFHHKRQLEDDVRVNYWMQASCGLLCDGWDAEAYEDAQKFMPYIRYHLDHKRKDNLKKAIKLEDQKYLIDACCLFFKASKMGRSREWGWTNIICCCLPNLFWGIQGQCLDSSEEFSCCSAWEDSDKKLFSAWKNLEKLVERVKKSTKK